MAALVTGLYGCSGCDDDDTRMQKLRTPPANKDSLVATVKKAKGSRDLDEIRHVLARGADPDGGEEGERKGAPLYWAARMGKTGATRLLAAKGAELDRVNESVGGTALMGAAKYRSKDAVEVLLKAGADPNVKTQRGRTALHAAATGGDVQVVSALLNAGAKANAKSQHGDTPLMEAVRRQQYVIVRLLAARGANINEPTKGDLTPVGYAMLHKDKKMVALLRELGASGGLPKSMAGWEKSIGKDGPKGQP